MTVAREWLQLPATPTALAVVVEGPVWDCGTAHWRAGNRGDEVALHALILGMSRLTLLIMTAVCITIPVSSRHRPWHSATGLAYEGTRREGGSRRLCTEVLRLAADGKWGGQRYNIHCSFDRILRRLLT